MSNNDPLGHYAKVDESKIWLTTSKGHDPLTPHVNVDEARQAARKILELDGGEHWVDIFYGSGEYIERIERQQA